MNKYAIRTLKHINRVQKWGLLLIERFPGRIILPKNLELDLISNLTRHDQTKFSIEQFEPYAIYFGADVKEGVIDANFKEAWKDHYTKENHHPKGFRHKRHYDPVIDIEIACDLQAMAEEFGEGSCRKYYETKWKKENCQYFSDDYEWASTCAMIEKCIDCFEALT